MRAARTCGWGNRHRRSWRLASAFLDSHAYPELTLNSQLSTLDLILTAPLSMLATIFAFDGVLADTLRLRAHALVDAAAAEQARLDTEVVLALLPGRTLLEASLALFPELATTDPTLPELIALRAQRGFRALVQHGVPLDQRALRRLQEAATRGDRIVVRADSERRDVESLLALAGLETSVSLLRCSDDAPRAPGASLQRSWEAIHMRLSDMGVGVPERTAFESNGETAETAALFVQVPNVW